VIDDIGPLGIVLAIAAWVLLAVIESSRR